MGQGLEAGSRIRDWIRVRVEVRVRDQGLDQG